MHVRVNLLVIRLPGISKDRNSLSKCDIFKLTDSQVKCVLIAANTGQEQTSFLVQIVVWEEIEDLMGYVEVALFEKCLHSLLEVLHYLACLYLGQVEFGRLRVTEALELIKDAFNIYAAELSVGDLPLLELRSAHVLKTATHLSTISAVT